MEIRKRHEISFSGSEVSLSVLKRLTNGVTDNWRRNRILFYLAGNYIFKVNNRNTRTRHEICSELTIKTPPLPKICQTFYNDETWHSYTLPKEDQKNICITWHSPWVLLALAFFSPEIGKFCCIKKCNSILIHNF